MGAPSGWGSTAVPEGGSCTGVKKGTPSAGLFSSDGLAGPWPGGMTGVLTGTTIRLVDIVGKNSVFSCTVL